MILAVDIGNSNIAFGCVEGDNILFESKIRTETTKTSDGYCVDLRILMDVHGVHPSQIEGAIIASVVPEVLNSVKTAIRKLTGKVALVVGPGLKTGLNLAVENPAQTGADIVAGCVAALREHKPPLIVVDMGSATTMMVLDKDGNFVGGSISPGVKMSLDALTDRTALLPGLRLDRPKQVIGRNTDDAMRSGIMLGAAAMLDGMSRRMEQEIGMTATVIATGTLAKFITPLCSRPVLYDPDLLLKGLAFLYRENVSR
jgi:type III pantothenate kinase